jgi:saccharopine dehydrogenase (NAD+, L-lysine-forming)
MTTNPPKPTILLRAEERPSERRTPLTPEGAAEVEAAGIRVLVESSTTRVYPDEEYRAQGLEIVPARSWLDADPDVVVLGIKELPDEPAQLRHRHIYFGHAYKGQQGAAELLRRFVAGGGELLDLEYLVNSSGQRVVAFGYWAGFVGGALGALQLAGELTAPLVPMSLDELAGKLESAGTRLTGATAVVTGAFGRAGRGATDALVLAGVGVSRWDRDDTRDLDSDALVAHDLLVHCVHANVPQPPFLTEADRTRPARRLRVLADVTADVPSDLNLLPVSNRLTSWSEPVRRIWDDPVPLDAIVIDNLPSLLPQQASQDFSSGLVPILPGLFTGDPVWGRAAATFHGAITGLELTAEV